MRALGTIVLTFALANFLAILGLIGWLVASDRLDQERLREVRQVFTETVSNRNVRLAKEQEQQQADEKTKEEAVKAKEPPVTSQDKLDIRLEQSEADKARMEKLKQESQQLNATIAQQMANLEALRAQVQTERDAFEKLRTENQKVDGSAQFKKTLGTLEGLKPDKVRTILQQLLDTKRPEDADQVIAYLNGMQERTRVRVMDEFTKSNPKLASELLERLRTRGLAAEPAPSPLASPVSGPSSGQK